MSAMTTLRAVSCGLRLSTSSQPMARIMLKQANWKAAQNFGSPTSSSLILRARVAGSPQTQRLSSSSYKQPPPPPREPLGSSSSRSIVGTVTEVCVGLYGYEQIQEFEAKKGSRKAYAALESITKHFVLSLDAIREGRYYVVLTSSVAHASGTHLLFNMVALLGFGQIFVQRFGLRHFATIWVGSAVVGSILQLGYWQEFERPGIKFGAVGAPGAVLGITSALSFVHPTMPVYLLFIPMTLRMCMVLSVALSLGAINQGWLPSLGHVEHLGGMAFGFVYWLIALRRGRVRSII